MKYISGRASNARWQGWVAIGAATAMTVNAFRLRSRARSLHTLQAPRARGRAEREYAFPRQRGEAHQPRDFTRAVLLAMNFLTPPVDMPWLPRSTTWSRWKRHSVFIASIPVIAVASALDHALTSVIERFDLSNTYRVLARRPT